ncbi:MAG TPA: imidazoleglycerol-phosphate dehydratase HisB [Thermoleophilaceae bacterium]|jgi:imidazoleglycerol-phosphate dehydratase
MSRTAEITRTTRETEIALTLALDGSGEGTRETGIGFLDHMLDAIARHGRLDLDVRARGDLETGPHHTVEDVGIVLGQALDAALGDRSGIARYGEATVPMDESRATAVIDLSGRPLAVFEGPFPDRAVGDLEAGLPEEMLRAVASTARLTLHVRVEAGGNDHHVVEAAFKAFALALRRAVAVDPTASGVPSTKGLL